MVEPTSGLEPLTCRLRIVRTEGTRRNPNDLQSRPRAKLHPMWPHSAVSGHHSGHQFLLSSFKTETFLRWEPGDLKTQRTQKARGDCNAIRL